MPGSASIFTWQLVKRIAILGGLSVATLSDEVKGKDTPEDTVDPVSEDRLKLIEEAIGDRCAVVRTHGGMTPYAKALVDQGRAQVFVSCRDLRNVALSLIEPDEKRRATGGDDDGETRDARDSIEMLQDAVRRLQSWVDGCDPLMISYDSASFDIGKTIAQIAARLEVDVRVDDVLGDKKGSVIPFNRGFRNRYATEMDKDTSRLFLRSFRDYYRAYFPEVLPLATSHLLGAPAEAAATHWHKFEKSGAGPFRWSAVDQVQWPNVALKDGLNRIAVPFFREVSGGFAKRCSLSVEGVEGKTTLVGNAIVAEFDVLESCVCTVTLKTPPPLRPCDIVKSADDRRLGLAIPVV